MIGLETVNRAGAPQRATDGDWDHVCWGDADTYQLGRIPMGLWVARNFLADTIVWSTGCSTRVADNKSEAEVMYEVARERYLDLYGFFPHRFTKRTWRTEAAYHAWLTRVSVFDNVSRTTSESMTVLRTKIRESVRATTPVIIYLVSSANHMPRVLRDAELAFDIGTTTARFMQRVTLFAIPAETNYGKGMVQDTKVDDLGRMLVDRPPIMDR